MKRIMVLLILILSGWQVAGASISVRVCGPVGEMPFDFQEIMVGQKLTFIISSDVDEYWSGALFIEEDDRQIGRLGARNSDPNTHDCDESRYPAAGDHAMVIPWTDSYIWGFDMYGSDSNRLPDDWYIIDYYAEQPGTCQVDFYDYNSSWDEPELSFEFVQLPSCDFNDDEIVNGLDFMRLAEYWLFDDCNDVNDCIPLDLNFDTTINGTDLEMFTNFWLWDGNINSSIVTPDPQDPNIIYSIVDANSIGDPNGTDEIYLSINESIRLYVELVTTDQNDVHYFDIEVNISDPNLGEIDNTEDPNGTAEILATPRFPLVDYWGPGQMQQEGIEFAAGYDFNYEISDGNMVSFVYTANNPGDVTLELINIESINMSGDRVYPLLNSMIIHQSDPNSIPMEGASAQPAQAVATSQASEPALATKEDIDEVIEILETMWLEDEELRNSVDPNEWQALMDSLYDMYE